MTSNFGPRIKRAIETSRFDVAEIAARLDCTVSTVYRWIREENRPSIDDLVRLAELTDRPVAWFTGEDAGDKSVSLAIVSGGRVVARYEVKSGQTIRIEID